MVLVYYFILEKPPITKVSLFPEATGSVGTDPHNLGSLTWIGG